VFFDFEFSSVHYETQNPDILAYGDSKRVHGQSAYNHYFTRNRGRQKLKNVFSELLYTNTFSYGIRYDLTF